MNNIENIQEYIPTVYVNDSEPDLDETNLNKTEQAIKRVTDAANKAIDALKQLDREKLALSAISNVLSDATDKVPSLALANTMQLAINDLNSNLDDRDVVADLLAIANAGPSGRRIVNCGGNTLNTPYKAGLTTLQSGTAIISMSSANYGTILYIAAGTDTVFLRPKVNGTWKGWERLLSNADVQNGSTTSISCTANAITELTITFPRAFNSKPKVVVSFYSDTTSTKYGMLTHMVFNVTTTNFKVRIANASDTTLNPAIYWIAR